MAMRRLPFLLCARLRACLSAPLHIQVHTG